MVNDDNLKFGYFLVNKTGKKVSPYFDYPLQAYKFNQKNFDNSEAFEIVKVHSKKLLCEKCGAKLKRISFIKFVCLNCGWEK